MVTVTDLAVRTLEKLQVLGAEVPSARDLKKAEDAVRTAHAQFKVWDILRWTLSDIPDYAEEPYVLMAAYNCADDFQVPQLDKWQVAAYRQLCAAANLHAQGPTQAEYF